MRDAAVKAFEMYFKAVGVCVDLAVFFIAMGAVVIGATAPLQGYAGIYSSLAVVAGLSVVMSQGLKYNKPLDGPNGLTPESDNGIALESKGSNRGLKHAPNLGVDFETSRERTDLGCGPSTASHLKVPRLNK